MGISLLVAVRAGLVAALLVIGGVARLVAAADAAPANPLAQIDGAPITEDDLDPAATLQVFRLEWQAYAAKRRALEQAIEQHLLAREAERRGLTVEALLDREVNAAVPPPSDNDIAIAQGRGLPANMTAEERAAAHEQTKLAILNRLRAERRARFVADLKAHARIVTHLREPDARITVRTHGAPVRGPRDAPVTIVEFGDFQCPFCAGVQSTLRQLLAEYPDRVRLVHRDFPVAELHPQARRAAEAGRCAAEQDKFWPYHDAIYASGLRRPTDIERAADTAGLDRTAFDACVAAHRHVAAIDASIADGKRIGVTATPTFFVNGIPLVGVQSLDSFKAAVQRALARTASDEGTKP